MAGINSENDYILSAKQNLQYVKTASITAIATRWYTTRHLAGNPGATAALTSAGAATTGSVWTDSTSGFPVLNAFGASAVGYLTGIEYGSTVACRLAIDDILWISPNINMLTVATSTFSSQPSYASRLPNTDYKGLKIFFEVASQTSNFTASNQFIVGYTNQDGTTGRTTGTISLLSTLVAASSPGSWFQLPLQAGDTGVQKIDSIQVTSAGTGATVFTGNVIVARNIWNGRVRLANDGDVHDMYKTGFPICFANMALHLRVAPDSTATGIPETYIQIANL